MCHNGGSMLFRLCVFGTILLSMTACKSMDAVGGAIQSASDRVDEVVDDVYTTVSNQPMFLGVRRNPCGCDDALEFEVNLGGEWRHVFLADSPALRDLRSEAQQHEDGDFFEFYFDDTQEIYVSVHGQKFYVFRPVTMKQ